MRIFRVTWFLLAFLIVPMAAFSGGQKESAATANASSATGTTITAFWPMDPKAAVAVKDYGDMLFFQEMAKKTGVTLKFQQPPAGQDQEQFNLLMASNTLPDLVYWDWALFPGGPGKAVSSGQIAKLNGLIDQYGPDFKKTMAEHPEWRKQVVLDDGTYYMIPKIKKDPYLLVSNGFQVRGDWLKKVNLPVPKTIADWYTMLKAFKTQAPNGNPKTVIPFTAYGTSLSSPYTSLRKFAYAWGIIVGFYMDGKAVKYGPIQPQYKAFLTEMHKWYAEGLIDPDFASQDQESFQAKVVGNRAGSYSGLVNGHMGKFLGIWAKDHPDYSLVGVPFPVGPAGKSYGDMNPNATGQGLAIAANSKNQAAAMKWANYLFTPDGITLSNFGVEGVTYKMENGVPVYTDVILHNPQGLPVINALSKYTPVASNGVLLQVEQSFRDIQNSIQQETTETWIKSTDTALNMPPAQPAGPDATKLGNIMNDVTTYVDEMMNKFIMGITPLDQFDSYVATIKGMGIDQATAIWQTTVDRYNSR